MTEQDFQNARQHIYGLAHDLAPDEQKQQQLITEIQQAELHSIRGGASNMDTIKLMLSPIMDGALYGNWPWAKMCEHQWVEQPGEPPRDVCFHCGKVRE
jgi:hypothetical protein